jgi:hypothetical protein
MDAQAPPYCSMVQVNDSMITMARHCCYPGYGKTSCPLPYHRKSFKTCPGLDKD